MAHVQMHQASDKGLGWADPFIKKQMQARELETEKQISRMQAGVSLQNKRSELDTELEKTRIHERNQFLIAVKKMGFDLQLKQMGIDMETTLQKMRNFNNMELAEFNRKTQEILSRMDNENKQSQIIKKYQTELKLANYNAKTALYRTFVDTFGDVLRNGDPASNAVDAAVYTAWISAFAPLFDLLKMDRSLDLSYDRSRDISDVKDTITSEGGKNEEIDKLNAAIEELQAALKNQGKPKGGPRNIIQNAKPDWETRQQIYLNKLHGTTEPR